MTVSEQQGAPGLTADAVAPDCEGCGEPLVGEAFVWSPYEADDGGAYCFSCAGRAWAGDVEALSRERRRVAAALAVLNAPMWESDDETDSTICRCESCLAETAGLAATYRCLECGYQGQPMAWGCLDPENVERMSQERGERYSLGNVTCPVCGEREFDADPWQAVRAIRQALADATGMHRGAFDADAARVNYTRDQYEHQRRQVETLRLAIIDALTCTDGMDTPPSAQFALTLTRSTLRRALADAPGQGGEGATDGR